jgi:ribosomal protein S18 acetylase RimI-like enzyme
MSKVEAVRTPDRADVDAIRAIVVANNMFPGAMLDDMMAPYFGGNEDELWFVIGDEPRAVAYAVPEKLTNGTWNQLMIAVDPMQHGSGLGRALMRHLEGVFHGRGARLVIVDTSGTEDFDGTREFYRAIGYDEVSRIPDFWDTDDDKITFRRLWA